MPMFLCPCCGEPFLVPLALCEFLLEGRAREEGRSGTIAPARCLACQQPIATGDSVIIRRGRGVSPDGATLDIPPGTQAAVVEVSTWKGAKGASFWYVSRMATRSMWRGRNWCPSSGGRSRLQARPPYAGDLALRNELL